jgi:hypothetical protein
MSAFGRLIQTAESQVRIIVLPFIYQFSKFTNKNSVKLTVVKGFLLSFAQ